MQREKASAFWVVVDWESADAPAVEKRPAPADDGLLADATAGTARLAVAMMAAAVRAVGNHARAGGRMARAL
jgi:hypothetical protein